MHRNTAELALGLCVVVLALLAIFAWVPNDTATGIIQKIRGRQSIGDAMAPTLAVLLIGLSGLLITLESRRKSAQEAPHVSLFNLGFLGVLTGIFLASVLLMRWSGPLLVGLFGPEGAVYRDLRDTMPWKLSGFVIGGTFLVGGLISLMQRRVSWTAVCVGLLTVGLLIAVFDLPFSDILLPPNGDL